MEIRDEEDGSPVDWGEIFFLLHKHCNLTKWEIWEYTLPQVGELMRHINKYIQFEAETRMAPLSAFAGVGEVDAKEVESDGDYREATEDDINMLAQILGGA